MAGCPQGRPAENFGLWADFSFLRGSPEVSETSPEVPRASGATKPECTKIARFLAVAVAFTGSPRNRAIFEPQDALFPCDPQSLANGDA